MGPRWRENVGQRERWFVSKDREATQTGEGEFEVTVTCPCYNILSHKCYLYFFPRPHVIMRQAFTPPHSHKEDYSVCVCSASVFTPPRRHTVTGLTGVTEPPFAGISPESA